MTRPERIIARILRNPPLDRIERAETAAYVAGELAGDKPGFDRAAFLAACGVKR